MSKRKCSLKSCPNRFYKEQMIVRGLQAWCNEDHQIQWAIQNGLRRIKKAKKQEDKEFNRRKVENKANDYSYQLRITKEAAQRLANRLDAGLPCICCDAPRGTAQFCGGHCITAKANSWLSVDLRNIHGQRNVLCNKHKSGNISGDKDSHGYKEGLRKRYGKALVDWLESAHNEKRSCEELKQMRKEYAAETRRLEKGLTPTKDWRALE